MGTVDEQRLHLLRAVPYFAPLGEEALADVAARLIIRQVAAGQIIFLEGSPCAGLHIVVKGLAKVYRASAEGREQVLALLGPGDSCNEVPVVDGGPNPANLAAVEPTTVLILSQADMSQLLVIYPALNKAVIRSLAARCRQLVARVYSLSFLSVRARLADFLLQQEQLGHPLDRRLWTQEEIATQIGTVREVVGRALSALADEGLIRLDRHHISVLDRKGLAALL